jgi:hypothetical protein
MLVMTDRCVFRIVIEISSWHMISRDGAAI